MEVLGGRRLLEGNHTREGLGRPQPQGPQLCSFMFPPPCCIPQSQPNDEIEGPRTKPQTKPEELHVLIGRFFEVFPQGNHFDLRGNKGLSLYETLQQAYTSPVSEPDLPKWFPTMEPLSAFCRTPPHVQQL